MLLRNLLLTDGSRYLCVSFVSSVSCLVLTGCNHPAQRLPVLSLAQIMPVCSVASQNAFCYSSGIVEKNLARGFDLLSLESGAFFCAFFSFFFPFCSRVEMC